MLDMLKSVDVNMVCKVLLVVAVVKPELFVAVKKKVKSLLGAA